MIEIDIPGGSRLRIEHLVLDYNGTLACDGAVLPGVREALCALADRVRLHVMTADTFGKAREGLDGIPCELVIAPPTDQDVAKREYVEALGAECTACVGNGRNDCLMLERAALGIAVVLEEGACGRTLASADVVCTDIVSALALLQHPLRLTATLRR